MKEMKEKKYRINFKRLALVVVSLVLGLLLLQSCIIACSRNAKAGTTQERDEPTQAMREIVVGSQSEIAAFAQPSEGQARKKAVVTEPMLIQVYDHKAKLVSQMDLEEYLIGVVAGEMPSSFAQEALRAQAVASRTYSVYGIRHGGCGTSKEADVCTNSQCCQAYVSEDSMRERLGNKFDTAYANIAGAVQATAGEALLFEGKVIEALYHGSAGGMTEDSEHVFSASRPYLRAVASDNEIGSRQEGELRIPVAEFIKKANAEYPKAGLSAKELVRQVCIQEAYKSGRVKLMQLGEVSITGKQCRKLFGLNSTQFTIAFTKEETIFTTKGFGHGVGMSQSGANGMAQAGSSYREILLHYYTGVSIENLSCPQGPN